MDTDLMTGYVAYASPLTIVTEAGYYQDPPPQTLPFSITTASITINGPTTLPPTSISFTVV